MDQQYQNYSETLKNRISECLLDIESKFAVEQVYRHEVICKYSKKHQYKVKKKQTKKHLPRGWNG